MSSGRSPLRLPRRRRASRSASRRSDGARQRAHGRGTSASVSTSAARRGLAERGQAGDDVEGQPDGLVAGIGDVCRRSVGEHVDVDMQDEGGRGCFDASQCSVGRACVLVYVDTEMRVMSRSARRRRSWSSSGSESRRSPPREARARAQQSRCPRARRHGREWRACGRAPSHQDFPRPWSQVCRGRARRRRRGGRSSTERANPATADRGSAVSTHDQRRPRLPGDLGHCRRDVSSDAHHD